LAATLLAAPCLRVAFAVVAFSATAFLAGVGGAATFFDALFSALFTASFTGAFLEVFFATVFAAEPTFTCADFKGADFEGEVFEAAFFTAAFAGLAGFTIVFVVVFEGVFETAVVTAAVFVTTFLDAGAALDASGFPADTPFAAVFLLATSATVRLLGAFTALAAFMGTAAFVGLPIFFPEAGAVFTAGVTAFAAVLPAGEASTFFTAPDGLGTTFCTGFELSVGFGTGPLGTIPFAAAVFGVTGVAAGFPDRGAICSFAGVLRGKVPVAATDGDEDPAAGAFCTKTADPEPACAALAVAGCFTPGAMVATAGFATGAALPEDDGLGFVGLGLDVVAGVEFAFGLGTPSNPLTPVGTGAGVFGGRTAGCDCGT